MNEVHLSLLDLLSLSLRDLLALLMQLTNLLNLSFSSGKFLLTLSSLALLFERINQALSVTRETGALLI